MILDEKLLQNLIEAPESPVVRSPKTTIWIYNAFS